MKEAAPVVIALITQAPEILTAVGVVITALVGFKALKQSKAAAVAAVHVANKVEDVRKTAADVASDVKRTTAQTTKDVAGALASISEVAEKTHVLVNSNMGTQLKLTAMHARRVAELTKDPADESVADEAERLLADHVRKQARVDAKAATSAGDKGA